jgi:plasmid stabilization system protein ParE
VKVVWSPRAYERVVEIGEFIALDRPNAAADWIQGILKTAEQLEIFPLSGRHLPELERVDYRELLHEGYRLIYRVDVDYVIMLTVRHSRQPLAPDDPDLQ